MPRRRFPLWPRSLTGQVLLALALALLLAQAIGATLQYRVQIERRRDAQVHMLAFRVLNAWRRAGEALPPRARREPPPPDGELAGRRDGDGPGRDGRHDDPGHAGPGGDAPNHDGMAHGPPEGGSLFRLMRPVSVPRFVPLAGEQRLGHTETELREIFAEQDVRLADVVVVERRLADDPTLRAALAARAAMVPRDDQPMSDRMLVAAVQRRPGGEWQVARALNLPGQPHMLAMLILQTVFLYAVLVGAMAFTIRRITRPLAALTARVGEFARTRSPQGRLQPQGPEDICRLIEAHNGMEDRIGALLDEKDVMLGAIGHDLKTPLAALRVRIECVEDEHERRKMADTIDDLARSLDDMLSLARVGRPSDPLETTELSAFVAALVEEFEDLGEPVALADSQRVVLPVRATWLRRALRNLVGNAIRYGGGARVAVARDGAQAVVRIEDDGPGIPEAAIARMLEPFKRGDPSRNSETGGAGLGLTLARAIAEQHGGTLTLANRRDGNGAIRGLSATLRLPLA
ncbi:MAG: two-component sensor histidine kinase [Sphingomonadales bacterium]|nr:two-component sensor histidine kinase [Sphingomonadales bacterium]